MFWMYCIRCSSTWWRHQMETFSALLAICAGKSPVPGEFPAQRPETRSFDVFFDLRLNKRLSKQSWGWWFETLSRPLWRHCNELQQHCGQLPMQRFSMDLDNFFCHSYIELIRLCSRTRYGINNAKLVLWMDYWKTVRTNCLNINGDINVLITVTNTWIF